MKKSRALFSVLLRSPVFWALVARVALFVILSPIEFQGDAADFQLVASSLAHGHGFTRCPMPPFPPTAQRPPLFPLILAGMYLLGAGSLWASFVLNVVFDLLSLWIARRWALENGFGKRGSDRFAWIIALCPLLIAYSPYPTTENLSICLFLAATLLTFRLGRHGARTPWASSALGAGIFWGLLALCRSYYLLFPGLLFVFPASPQWRRARLAVLVACSTLAPSVWIARNYNVFGKASFSQGSTVGWQSFQGLCFTNFDWWDDRDVAQIYRHPMMSRIIASQCKPDDEIGALDQQVKDEVLRDCVLGRPLQASFNVAAKGAMLFINWGQALPYTRIPGWIRWPINAALAFYWWCVLALVVRSRRQSKHRARSKSRASGSALSTASAFAGIGVAYVVVVTLPFAVDSRYLLGPFLITLVAALESAGGARKLALSGLISPWALLRRGSRTL